MPKPKNMIHDVPPLEHRKMLASGIKETTDFLLERGVAGRHIALALMCAGIDGLSTYTSIPEIMVIAEAQAEAIAANQAKKAAH